MHRVKITEQITLTYTILYHKVYILDSLLFNEQVILKDWTRIVHFIEYFNCFSRGVLEEGMHYMVEDIYFYRVTKNKKPYLRITILNEHIYFNKVYCLHFLSIANRIIARVNLLHESINKKGV